MLPYTDLALQFPHLLLMHAGIEEKSAFERKILSYCLEGGVPMFYVCVDRACLFCAGH